MKIVVSNYGDGFNYDRADLVNPVLIDADGNETSLTKLKATSYTSEWGNLHINKNVENGPLRVEGKSYTTGLGLNAQWVNSQFTNSQFTFLKNNIQHIKWLLIKNKRYLI